MLSVLDSTIRGDGLPGRGAGGAPLAATGARAARLRAPRLRDRLERQLLGRELGAKLTGRHVSAEVYPFSFREYLDFRAAASAASLAELGGEVSPARCSSRARPGIAARAAAGRGASRHRLAPRPALGEASHESRPPSPGAPGQPLSLQSLAKGLAIPSVAQTARYVEYLQDAWLFRRCRGSAPPSGDASSARRSTTRSIPVSPPPTAQSDARSRTPTGERRAPGLAPPRGLADLRGRCPPVGVRLRDPAPRDPGLRQAHARQSPRELRGLCQAAGLAGRPGHGRADCWSSRSTRRMCLWKRDGGFASFRRGNGWTDG